MKCHEITDSFDELLDDKLQTKQSQKLRQHLAVCSACNAALAEHQEYREQLSQFSVPEPAAGYYALLLRQARVDGEQQKQQRVARQHRFQGFAVAAVLAFGIFAVFNLGQSGLPSGGGTEQFAQQPELVSEEITVLINVPADMLGAKLALEFPEELILQGFEHDQQLAWQLDLKKGPNAITLPVLTSGSFVHGKKLLVSAQIEYNNKSKQFQLPVELFSPHKARHELVPTHRAHTTYII